MKTTNKIMNKIITNKKFRKSVSKMKSKGDSDYLVIKITSFRKIIIELKEILSLSNHHHRH